MSEYPEHPERPEYPGVDPDRRPDGLTDREAADRLRRFGPNEPAPHKKENFLLKVLHILAEPMFLLLICASVIYFLLGEARDGAVMLLFVVGVIGIDVIQEWKTDKTLSALRDLSAPSATVLRSGKEKTIPSTELVPGDIMLIQEGEKIPADGVVVRCNDLCVDESSLTGEPEGVWKVVSGPVPQNGDYWRRDYCYAGTLVTQGSAAVEIDATGAQTEYGKIGAGVAAAEDRPTPLQKQTAHLVKVCAFIAAGLFLLVALVTWVNLTGHSPTDRLIQAVLSGITLAMAMIPEEFPVILTVFLSMGAWRLAKKNSLVRRLPSVETLGAVSVLCVDKTGTITMNQMEVQELWAPDGDEHTLCQTMGRGCETDAYDPMEKAMVRCCEARGISHGHLFDGELVKEYPFTNDLKMMGHVWKRGDRIFAAAKGSPERLMTLCGMTGDERAEADRRVRALSERGLRVIAVGSQYFDRREDVPEAITGCRLRFLGLVGLADPPRPGVAKDIALCNRAGIRVVMITGDNGVTAAAIARQIGMRGFDHVITGDELEKMSDEALREKVKDVSIFSRVIPAHKMRIVNAFKANGEIVAMTGDGVNDAPALKNADIGIAMGKRGSEVSREAADLILMDDNFSTIVDTVRDGRRIYDNIRKAVGYIFTIHIPIAFSSLLAPMLGIAPSDLFLLPLHVVLMELIIDPTCSIVLERQPAERDIMDRPPRSPDEKLLTAGTLSRSILQGVVLFAAAFGSYLLLMRRGLGTPAARAFGLSVILFANLFLVQVNSSDRDFAVVSLGRLLHDKVMWAVGVGTVALLLAILYTPLCSFLKLAPLSFGQLAAALGVAAASVLWYDVVKALRRIPRRGA